MCWISEVLKAENSGESKIPVIKVLRRYIDSKELAAYYRATPYVLNKEYNSSILPRFVDSCFEINEGLHCYSDSCRFTIFETGIHIFTLEDSCVTYSDGKRLDFAGIRPYKAVVVKGYIPSNTRFYINEIGEIVTQRLILTSVLEIFI